MANNPRPPIPPQYANTPRQPHRGVAESVIFPGHGNPQNRHNNMLHGLVHVNSPLPSQQFPPQATDPRVTDFRTLQSQTKQNLVPPQQHQQAFTPTDQSQIPLQASTPAHMQGWPARNNDPVHNGVQNPQTQPANVLDMTSLTGPFKLPPGTSLLFRNTPAAAASSAQSSPNASTMQATSSRSISDVAQSSSSVADTAPFQIPISAPSAVAPQPGTHSGPSTPFVRHPAPHAPSPYINATNQHLMHRPPSHPNASTNPHSLSASDLRMSQSPARSATVTPSSSVNPPPPQLVDSRDSLQVQLQSSRAHQHHPPQQHSSHQQGMQLHPPPGSSPAPLPPMQQLPESVLRQQHMLSQRGQQPTQQLARHNFPVPSNPNQFPQRPAPQAQQTAPNAAIQHQQLGFFSHQTNPGGAQPMQSRPSSRASGFGPPAIAQPTEPGDQTPKDSRNKYSDQQSAGSQSSQPSSDASSQFSARPSAPMTGPPRPLSGHQGNGSPGVPRPGLLTIPSPPNGLGTVKVLEFCTGIANKKPESNVSWWQSFMQTFVHPSGFFEITLWRVSDSRKFHLKSAILGRFFHRTFSCGVQDLNISFHSPKETPLAGGGVRVHVEAAWMFTYASGYTVTLSGPLEVAIQPGAPTPELNGISAPAMRFTTIQFVAVKVDKKIYCEAIEGKRSNGDPGLGYENMKRGQPHPADTDGSSPWMGLTGKQTTTRNSNASWVEIERAKLPPDPVNEYGIPQSLLVCLDLSDSIGGLTDLFKYSRDHDVGPIDSLKKVANELRAQRPDFAETIKSRPLTVGAPSRQEYWEAKPPFATPPPTTTHSTMNTGPSIKSSPMQIDRPAPTQIPGPHHQSSNTSPKSTGSTSDLSNVSSPPTAVMKRKLIMEEPEQSVSASDPPPSSSGRRRNNTSDTASTLSTRSTRQQHRRQTSPRPTGVSGRPRRRGGTS